VPFIYYSNSQIQTSSNQYQRRVRAFVVKEALSDQTVTDIQILYIILIIDGETLSLGIIDTAIHLFLMLTF